MGFGKRTSQMLPPFEVGFDNGVYNSTRGHRAMGGGQRLAVQWVLWPAFTRALKSRVIWSYMVQQSQSNDPTKKYVIIPEFTPSN